MIRDERAGHVIDALVINPATSAEREVNDARRTARELADDQRCQTVTSVEVKRAGQTASRRRRRWSTDEPACKPDSVVPHAAPAAIPLGLPLPAASCGLPAGLGGPPSNTCAGRRAPSGVRRPSWPCSRWGLPSRPSHLGRWWSLTPPFHPYRPWPKPRPAVCFLWHCPAGHPGWVLPTTLPCGVRTFLGDPVSRTDAAARPARPPC